MTRRVQIDHLGPIEHLEFDVPQNGGLVILRGQNGRGKTTALNAVEAALSGRGRPTASDHAPATGGSIDVCGVRITVARSVRRRGELEVTSLAGKFDVAALVDPGVQDAGAADARRIKALVALTNVQPDPQMFRELLPLPGEFDSVVKPDSLTGDDVVLMAERVKRDIEAEARKREAEAETLAARALGMRPAESADDETDEACDIERLRATFSQASNELRDITQRQSTAREAHERAATARAEFERMHGAEIEARVAAADAEFIAARDAEAAAVAEVTRLRELLREAERVAGEAQRRKMAATQAVDNANAARRNLRALQATLAQALPDEVPQRDVEDARERMVQASQAVELAGVLLDRRRRRTEADATAMAGQRAALLGERMREAAKAVDVLLSRLVADAGTTLRVNAGRLVLDTAARGETFFHELSAGERWAVVLPIAIRAVGPNGVFVIPQEAFEGLDPLNRERLADALVGTGVVGITAEATEDEQVTADVVE